MASEDAGADCPETAGVASEDPAADCCEPSAAGISFTAGSVGASSHGARARAFAAPVDSIDWLASAAAEASGIGVTPDALAFVAADAASLTTGASDISSCHGAKAGAAATSATLGADAKPASQDVNADAGADADLETSTVSPPTGFCVSALSAPSTRASCGEFGPVDCASSTAFAERTGTAAAASTARDGVTACRVAASC